MKRTRKLSSFFLVFDPSTHYAILFLSFYDVMDACLRGGKYLTDDPTELYDVRYFYLDPDQIGRCTCGVALEVMMRFVRQRKFTSLGNDLWYEAVADTTNPVIRGYLAEQILLEHIAYAGLPFVDKALGKMDYASFMGRPVWKMDQRCCLYIPSDYNFPAIDGVILLLDHSHKSATLFPLQITLSRSHKNSEDSFYRKYWSKWIQPLEEAEFTAKSTFVWIDYQGPSMEWKPKLFRELRDNTVLLSPEHYSGHIGVRHVDKRLAMNLVSAG